MKVDMSPEAVTIRLKRASQLRRLCVELGKMNPVAAAPKTANANSCAADRESTIESGDDRNLTMHAASKSYHGDLGKAS